MKFRYVFILITVLFITSCLTNDEDKIAAIEINQSATLLGSLEARGDFINTIEAPGLLTPENVFLHRNNYLILDIRDSASYSQGHIPGALLVSHQNLPVIAEENAYKFNKIVLVSHSGQSACFYTTLLRYLRYENIYALQFGMASWNSNFSKPWLDAITNNFSILHYSTTHYGMNPKDLPYVEMLEEGYEATVEFRIRELFGKYYADRLFETEPGELVVDEFKLIEKPAIVCYGPYAFFSSNKYGIGPPKGAGYFQDKIRFEFRSDHSLQAMPPEREIIVYSANGFRSASIVAYLNILGYRARSLNFGACRFTYTGISQLRADEFLYYAPFQTKNYEYETGFQ